MKWQQNTEKLHPTIILQSSFVMYGVIQCNRVEKDVHPYARKSIKYASNSHAYTKLIGCIILNAAKGNLHV